MVPYPISTFLLDAIKYRLYPPQTGGGGDINGNSISSVPTTIGAAGGFDYMFDVATATWYLQYVSLGV